MRTDVDVLVWVRRALLWTLTLGVVGTTAELLLIGHFEGRAQLIPLGLLAFGLISATVHAARPSRFSVRILQAVMTAYVMAGVAGVMLHFRGNLEFEREMYPTMTGVELIGKVATGATPVLAPGAMSLLGVIGLLHVYRHPALASVSEKGKKP